MGHQPGRRVGPAVHSRHRLQHLRLVPMREHRVGEEVVRPHRVMRRGAGLHAGAARAGHGEERRRHVEPGPRERIERELSRGGEAAGRRDGPGAAELGAEDVGETVGEAGEQLGRGVRAVVPLVERAHRAPGSRPRDPRPARARRRAPHPPPATTRRARGRGTRRRAPRAASPGVAPENRASVSAASAGMDVADRLPRLAPAGRDPLGHLGVLRAGAAAARRRRNRRRRSRRPSCATDRRRPARRSGARAAAPARSAVQPASASRTAATRPAARGGRCGPGGRARP